MAVGFFFAMNLWSSETGVSGLPMADGLADQPLVAYEEANGQSAECGVCDMRRDAASDPGVTCGERLDMAARQPAAAAPDPAAGAWPADVLSQLLELIGGLTEESSVMSN